MSELQLPEWAEKTGENEYTIYSDIAYPQLLDELTEIGRKPATGGKEVADALRNEASQDSPSQWALEMVYQFAKLDLRRALLLNGESAWPRVVRIKGDKQRWALKNHPLGRGPWAATQGKEARRLYKAIRGFIPG